MRIDVLWKLVEAPAQEDGVILRMDEYRGGWMSTEEEG